MKRRFAIVVGLDYYASFLADLVNERSIHWRLKAFGTGSKLGTVFALAAVRHADAIISFGGPAPDVPLIEAARRRNIPIVVIWAGSDVIKASTKPQELQVIREEGFLHLSDGPWLVDELRVLGIEAEYLPLTAVRPGSEPQPLPAQFRVMTYLPEPRRDFYGEDLTYAIAAEFPEVPFTVVGAGGANPAAPPNVEFCGYVNDTARRLDESTVLLRVPQHDGKSMFVLEALSRGRHVIWNYDFPHVRTAKTCEEMIAALRSLRDAHAKGELPVNEAGRKFVLANFARADLALRFEDRLSRLVRDKPTNLSHRPRRVAISGLDLFCAQIAHHTKRVSSEWEPRALRTTSRLQVLTAIYNVMVSDVWYSIGTPLTDRWVTMAANLLRKPRVVHWVGSDIVFAREHPNQPILHANNVIHLAEVDWTIRELGTLGIRAELAPLPPRQNDGAACPLPSRFTAVLYVPLARGDFYGRRLFERLMRSLRDEPIEYLIVGGGELDVPEGVHATSLGWLGDLSDVYRRSSVLVRFTPRDGLSLMVLEALSFGRHVLWSKPFPYVELVRTYDDVEAHMVALLRKHQSGELQPQVEAASMIHERYSTKECIKRIVAAWDQAVAQPRNASLPAQQPLSAE